MMKENKDLAKAFKDRFPKDWVKRKAFIKDLIDGEKVILIYVYICLKVFVFEKAPGRIHIHYYDVKSMSRL